MICANCGKEIEEEKDLCDACAELLGKETGPHEGVSELVVMFVIGVVVLVAMGVLVYLHVAS